VLVNIGGIAAKIATGLGFQKGDDVLETLKEGSIFTDILQEHWRHQLLSYNIVSFWGSIDNVSIVVIFDAIALGVCRVGASYDCTLLTVYQHRLWQRKAHDSACQVIEKTL
jgi:hypothetical protein